MGIELILFTTMSPRLWAYGTWADGGHHQNGDTGVGAVLQRTTGHLALGTELRYLWDYGGGQLVYTPGRGRPL